MTKKKSFYQSISEKTNKLLTIVFVLFLFILARLWFLTIIKHEEKVAESLKPQKKIVIQRAERASICDRFGVTLAENKPQYNINLCYAPIRELPAWVWSFNEKGDKVKLFFRKGYIKNLSQFLAAELHLDPQYIEDIIHSKAAILGSVPCVIKENVTEEKYLRLKILEKDWPGLQAEVVGRRYYPQGKVAANVLGYIGPVSKEEYQRVTQELHLLRKCVIEWEEGQEPNLPKGFTDIEEVITALKKLEKKAYGINDFVGKSGIESSCDTILRGSLGKKVYLVDRQGNFIRELDDSFSAEPGKKVFLTISSELQRFAEDLLLDYERSNQLSTRFIQKKAKLPPLFPWIKGGAIIALNPRNGEILALASSPSFDPNDFVSLKNTSLVDGEESLSKVYRWLENKEHIAELWDFKTTLQRERRHVLTSQYYKEFLDLTWTNYLNLILPDISEVKKKLCNNFSVIREVLILQNVIHYLLQLFKDPLKEVHLSPRKVFDFVFPETEGHIVFGDILSLKEQKFLAEHYNHIKEQIKNIKNILEEKFDSLTLNFDKLLLVDLCRLSVCVEEDTKFLPLSILNNSIEEHREMEGLYNAISDIFKKKINEIFREHNFALWRQSHFKSFLSKKREEERVNKKKFPLPYIDYLNKECSRQFEAFWSHNKHFFMLYLLTGVSAIKYEENDPFYLELSNWYIELEKGAHQAIAWRKKYLRLKELCKQYVSEDLLAYFSLFRSFNDLNRPLLGSYHKSILSQEMLLEKHLAAMFYPSYGYGFLRSHAFCQAAIIGSIFKLVTAYTALSQQYLYQKNCNINSLVMVDHKHSDWKNKKLNVGFFNDGSPIPIFYKGGRLPRSDFVGPEKLDLIKALEVSSNPYFSLLAGDILSDPQDLLDAAALLGFGERTGIKLPGEYGGLLPKDIIYDRTGLYATAIGQHSLVTTPLQTANMLATLVNGGHLFVPKILLKVVDSVSEEVIGAEKKRDIFLPNQVANILIQGMRRVVLGEKGTARSLRSLFPESIYSSVIGKTSTAESLERVSLDGSLGLMKLKHVWFGAVGFDSSELEVPEIVVVVYSRYGEFGKDVSPLAVRVIEKWKEIQKKYSTD